MVDREKVIKGLECCCAISGDDCRKCPYGNECRDTDLPYGMPHLAADVLALLKEQEAVKPYVTGSGKTFECRLSWWYACGNCNKPIDIDDKYCRHCGRAVKRE